MAKIRIHEIAKELKIQSKDVIEFLKEKNIFGKVANSSIEDDVIAMVRNKFVGGKTEAPKSEISKPETSKKDLKLEKNTTKDVKVEKNTVKDSKQGIGESEKMKSETSKVEVVKSETIKKDSLEEKTTERPKKKSSITAVFNPQNSKTAPRRQARPQGEKNNKVQGDKTNKSQDDKINRNQRGDKVIKAQEEQPVRDRKSVV